MQEVRKRRAIGVGLRARMPLVTRALALLILITGIVYVGVSYYHHRHNEPFMMHSGAPELSKEITGIVNGYEQQITKNDRLYLWLRASRDVTYADGHHELEDVDLKVYPPTGDKPDRITAQRSIYDQKNGIVSFSGDVNVETRNALVVKTERLFYNQNSEVAETKDPVTFFRDNISGHATGAVVDAKNKHLELRSAVEIVIVPEAKNSSPSKSSQRAEPVTIHSSRAVFDQNSLHFSLTGGATAEQGGDVMSGDQIEGTLNEHQRLQKLEARGNSYLRSMSEGRAAEIHSVDMDFFFDNDQQLQHAVASQDIHARSLGSDSEMQLNGAKSLDVDFQPQGQRSLLKEMRADGRSVLLLAAPQSHATDPRAANKRLTADAVKLSWRTTGRDLERAEAVGSAELFVDPVQKTPTADRKTLTAPRFDCDFYETGNLARTFTATGGAKAVIDPVQPTEQRATRTLTSQKMVAVFARETQDVERFDAQGDAKFNEKDRNAVAANASYSAADEMVRLRGNDPTVWDSRARTRAVEIDSDTRNEISYGRGKTATTYYSQEQTGGAAPFSKTKSPVYISSDRSELRHTTGVAIYTGNARMWQDDNFASADRITLYRDAKRMEGDGHVKSALYQARRRQPNGGSEVVPVFATSDRMWYSDVDRLLHYDGSVDIRQATDRVTSAVADVYLLKDSNEVEKTISQRNVVMTQPGRRGTGDWAQYTAADETMVLTGKPARVEDTEQGTTEGGRLTLYLRDSRVIADSPGGAQSTGRVHSTHRIRSKP